MWAVLRGPRLRVVGTAGALGTLRRLQGRRQEERLPVSQEGEAVLMAGPLVSLGGGGSCTALKALQLASNGQRSS